MHRSYTAQTLQNYLDPSDGRARRRPHALIGQFSNAAALGLDRASDAYGLEVAGLSLSPPTNLDNRGVWYASPVPNGYTPGTNPDGTTTFGVIAGCINGSWKTVIPFDPLNPVPSGVVADPSRSTTYLGSGLASNVVLTATGNLGVQLFYPNTTLTVPNWLTLVVSGIIISSPAATVQINGYAAVTTPIQAMRQEVSETIDITDNGTFRTTTAWSQITEIRIYSLDSVATVSFLNFAFGTPYAPGVDAYVSAANRQDPLPLQWVVANGGPAGYVKQDKTMAYELVQFYAPGLSYLPPSAPGSSTTALSQTIVDDGTTITASGAYTYLPSFATSVACPEPNTNGLLLASGSSLYWMDRRPLWPASLIGTGSSLEPAYSLHCNPDITWTGLTPAVALSGTAAARASDVQCWRYTAIDPNAVQWAVAPEGGMITLSPSVGWRTGPVLDVRVILNVIGDWKFYLELQESGSVGYSQDMEVWPNRPPTAQAVLSAAALTSQIDGLDFDYRNRLWIRSGDFAIPANLIYDAYQYDSSSGTLYFTQPYGQVILA